MPILTVKLAARKSPELTHAVSRTLVELTERILKKKAELVAIAIDYADPDDWTIGGVSLTSLGKTSFYFDIRITDETNTKGEKEQYLREAFAALSDILGNVHEKSYIHVHDVRAASYGYGGRTQEYRYHH